MDNEALKESLKGRIILDIPPKLNNPRNSEGAFITLKNGHILFVYSRFTGSNAKDNAPADLACIESPDEGETWSDEQIILSADQDKASNIMSVSLTRMLNGDVGLFYFVRHGFENSKEHLRRSSDEGKSWSDSVSCVKAAGYYVTNNDRVVRLCDGRLIVPAGYHRANNEDDMRVWDKSSITIYYYSDDDGQTWSESNQCSINVRHTRSGLQEPGLVELKNGALYGWARTDIGMQYEMFSFDRGTTWTEPQPSRFTSPCSPLSMKRDPNTGNLIAIWNPVPNYITRRQPFGKITRGRTPFVCSISFNDGLSWEEPFTLEDDSMRGFCYTAMHFVKNDLLLAYCAGGSSDGGCLNRLRIKKIPLTLI